MQLLSFGGSQLAIPGAYSVVNIQKSTPVSVGALKVLAVIGSGNAGQPGTPLYFNDPSIAQKQIGGTDALLLAQLAWEHGADLICMSLTDVATQATYALKSTDATPVTLVTYGGKRWNTTDNDLQITTTAAANGSQTVTITDTSVTPNVTETYTVADTAAGWTNHVNQVNAQSALVTATAGPGGSASNTAATVTNMSFSGGTRTAATTTSISDAINALETEDIQGIITSATDATTQSAIFSHCNTMSNVQNRMERRAFFGQAIGTAVSGYQTAIQSFASSNRASVVAPGIYRAVNGQKTLLSSAFTAACVAGLWAGMANPNNPVTFKFINALGLEFNYLPGTDITTLTQAQVTVIQNVPKKGYRIVRGLTSDTTGTMLVNLSTADLVDVMVRALRELMEDRFVGQAGRNGLSQDMTQYATSICESFKKKNWIVDGTDAFGQPLPAYRNISVTQSGTAYPLNVELNPDEEVDYIPITANINV